MIKTKLMAGRDNTLPYVNSSNNLVGTCSALKHFFCKNGVGLVTDTVTDAVGKVISAVDTIGHFATTGNYFAATLSIASECHASSPAWSTLGTADVLMVVAAQPTAAATNMIRFQAGTTTAGSHGVMVVANTAGTGASAIADGVAAPTLGAVSAVTNGEDLTLIAAFDRNSATGGMVRKCKTTIASAASNTPTDITTAQASIVPSAEITLRGNIYGAAIFAFPSGLPLNWEAKAKWMAEQWKSGSFVFPNGW